ncbi:hypothetical protein PVAND_012252 [Polypedilum vanderplanki]|uniref:Uncharacterized protein n=1 Tax=Polypedilum vanderplanki TaxID=319348 RepID=A0A9J6CMU0_POLVA|nr:hypothetical protein PVAND_012252 [Polypedilum vanderplanki]
MSLIINNNNNLDEANGNLIMGSTTTTTAASTAANYRNSNNNDEDSASSNYTDPEDQNDSTSAPTELLAEFLTSIMRKDYANALKYCKMILDYEPNNKPAKDFFPELLMRVNQQQQQQQQSSSSSARSDENCNYTSSLEVVDNEILDNDMIDDNYYYSDSSSLSSSNSNSTTTNGSMDLNSYEDEINNQENEQDQDDQDLINQHSFSSNDSSKSDPFPESQSSSESIDHRMISPTFSFTSLLLEESDEINGNASNEPLLLPQQEQTIAETSAQPPQPTSSSSPFTSKIVNMIRRKLN